MRALCTSLCVAVALLAPGFGQSEEPASWLGTWLLDTSAAGSDGQYKRVTLRLEPWENDGLRAIYDMVGRRGGVIHLEWAGKVDGRDYPVQGLDYVMTNAYTRIDARSYSILVKVDGIPRVTTLVTVSPDGTTMSAVTDDRSGRSPVTAVYRRKPPSRSRPY
jgi:hypothetical protein